MSGLPTGTITFLFTDIQGSTKLWEQYPEAMRAALERHNAVLRAALEAHGGHVFKTVGDAFCAAFATAPDALNAALAAQRALHAQLWGETGRLRVRMALHTGTAEASGGDYMGLSLSRVARLLAAAHGDQVLLSRATQELVHDQLPPGVTLRDLGAHQLKDLTRPEHILQVLAPDLPAEFPPLKTLSSRPSNLPAQMTPLIGREQEIAAACRLLRRADVRLLNLIGPGGTGKTRLGLQVATDLLDDFENGIYFVALTPISAPTLVATTIAQTLGMKEDGGQPVVESLKDFLRDKQALLLLDNFEQVVEAAPLLAELLAAAPRLKLLITSRAVLHLSGEYAFPVPPLALPDPARFPAQEADLVSTLSQYTAVGLFIQRAQAIKPDFQVTTANAPAVAEICARLDGLPLAIELAAARIKLFTPQALLARLSSRLKLLVGGGQDRPARQQTLRSAIDWSYDLLDSGEQRLFRLSGVFAGGCTAETAEAICESPDLRIDDRSSILHPPSSILDRLASLADKSLLRQAAGADGEPRFMMLETIREYALERLTTSGEIGELQRRHATFFLRLAEQAEPELYAAEQLAWLERLETEHDNMRAVLAWSQAEPDGADVGLRLAGALWVFWYKRGYISEGRTWLAGALARSQPQAATRERARALHGAGSLALHQNDTESAALLLEESLALYQELGDKPGSAWAMSDLGHVAFYRGDDERASTHYTESLALSRELGDTYNSAWALDHIGCVALRRGDFGRAQNLLTESLAIFEGMRHTAGIATLLNHLGCVALRCGDFGRAQGLLAESLALFRALNQKRNIALCLTGVAEIAIAEGQPQRAAQLLGAAEGLRTDIGAILAPDDRDHYERNVGAVRAHLDPASFAAAWTAGRSTPLDQLTAV